MTFVVFNGEEVYRSWNERAAEQFAKQLAERNGMTGSVALATWWDNDGNEIQLQYR